MVTTPYHRGRAREYKALEILRGEGWLCSRSAMSHGPVDIFAARDGEVLLVQVKSGGGRARPQELEELKRWAKAFRARAEVWHFKKGGTLHRTVVADLAEKVG
jgi:Holliday junction resolvase